MSKAVKKQLALLSGGVDKPADEKKPKYAKRKAQRKAQKAAAAATQAAHDPVRLQEANLRYYRRTAAPSSATQELIDRVSTHRWRDGMPCRRRGGDVPSSP
jgi:hypothetical protein